MPSLPYLVGYALLLGLGCTLFAPSSVAGTLLLDPAVRHTNGLPIASSSPLRNSSVDWTCNPDKLGWCGGQYYIPCLDSIRPSRIAADYRRHHGAPCAGPLASSPSIGSPGTADGLEQPGMVPLGSLPNDGLASGMLIPPGRGGGQMPGLSLPPPAPR